MRRALFFIATLTIVSILSSCWGYFTNDFDFHNRSSYIIMVDAEGDTFTLWPGEDKEVTTFSSDLDDYTYIPVALVETGKLSTSYYFWDKGSPRPY